MQYHFKISINISWNIWGIHLIIMSLFFNTYQKILSLYVYPIITYYNYGLIGTNLYWHVLQFKSCNIVINVSQLGKCVS